MQEIGGYIELDTYHFPMLHTKAIALNCGRNALAYVLRSRKIRRIRIPYLLCSSIADTCAREGVAYKYYHIRDDFQPERSLILDDDEWLYLVNYYGQLDNNQINILVKKYVRVIVDQAHSYFQEPLIGIDTIYTCRKYFGVADGAFLYTESKLDCLLEQDESFDRMRFLLGRFERSANEFYQEYVENNYFFSHEPIKLMSKLTANLLKGIDYALIQSMREKNYLYLHNRLGRKNALRLQSFPGSYMYPFFVDNGVSIRKILREKKIYIPLLWPRTLDITHTSSVEYQFANNILPLPIDQRYGLIEMEYLADNVLDIINKG